MTLSNVVKFCEYRLSGLRREEKHPFATAISYRLHGTSKINLMITAAALFAEVLTEGCEGSHNREGIIQPQTFSFNRGKIGAERNAKGYPAFCGLWGT